MALAAVGCDNFPFSLLETGDKEDSSVLANVSVDSVDDDDEENALLLLEITSVLANVAVDSVEDADTENTLLLLEIKPPLKYVWLLLPRQIGLGDDTNVLAHDLLADGGCLGTACRMDTPLALVVAALVHQRCGRRAARFLPHQ